MIRHRLLVAAVVVADPIVNDREISPMKRGTIAFILFIAMLSFTVPLVLADDTPPPSSGGGCTGPDCK